MATTQEGTTLQELAQRHLWMHFSRMGAFGPDHEDSHDQGVWKSIRVDDVDEIYRHCLEHGIEVTWPPTDEPWHVREMHVRHPDGHVFRISKGLGEA